LNLKEQNQIN